MAKSAAGQSLDLINIMAYDAGNKAINGFDPLESFNSQRAAFPSAAVALGVEVPPEAWGGNVVTLAQVKEYAQYVKANGGRGMMIWSLQKKGTPTAAAISNTVCTTLGMGNCTQTYPF
jgi:chitinase